jgi:MOSC domain-containing protein YiiM
VAGHVSAVSSSPAHTFSKPTRDAIRLLAGLGVEGDAHLGATIRHRHRARRNAALPNLRQVHLIHAELHDELRAAGFAVAEGEMGENVTTRGVDLLSLPSGTRLRLGDAAVVEVTGLREPCVQLNRYRKGLVKAVTVRDEHGGPGYKAGSWPWSWRAARSGPATRSRWCCPRCHIGRWPWCDPPQRTRVA